jgi:hypothetical protein
LLGPNAEKIGMEAGPFLPEQLSDLVAASDMADAAGSRPAVLETMTVHTSRNSAEQPYTGEPVIFIIIVGTLAIIATFFSSSRLTLLFDVGLFSASLLSALAICTFWLLAGYAETGWNLNFLWMNPLALVALILAGRKRAVPTSRLFLVAGILSLVITISGGVGLQEIGLEARILAAIIALRCVSRSRTFPIVRSAPARP